MDDYEFDVITALHDDLKGGGNHKSVRSRVIVSRQEFPTYGLAADVAGCMAVAAHGGMPTAILARY